MLKPLRFPNQFLVAIFQSLFWDIKFLFSGSLYRLCQKTTLVSPWTLESSWLTDLLEKINPNIAKEEKGNTCLYSFWWSIKAPRSRTKWKWVSLPSLPVTTDVVLRKSMNSYGSWFYHLENEIIVGLISGLNKIRHAQHLCSRSSRNDSCRLLFHLYVQPPGKKYIWSLRTWEIFLSLVWKHLANRRCSINVRSLSDLYVPHQTAGVHWSITPLIYYLASICTATVKQTSSHFLIPHSRRGESGRNE